MQKTYWYYDENDLYYYSRCITINSFHQDIKLGLFPFRDDEFSIEIKPKNDDFCKKIHAALENQDSYSGFEKTVSNFVETAISTMIYHGVAHYEIVIDSDSQSFYFAPIQSGVKIKTKHKIHLLRYPKNKTATQHKLPLKIEIPKGDLMSIEIPQVLGGKRRIISILKKMFLIHRTEFDYVDQYRLQDMRSTSNNKLNVDIQKYGIIQKNCNF